MRSFLITVNFAGTILFFAGSAPASDARALLERAIKAHGGAARLERTKKGHLKAKVENRLGNDVSKYELEETFDLPGRYRQTFDGTVNDSPFHRDCAFTGKAGWKREGTGPAHEISIREQRPLEQHWHAILALLLLLRSKDIDLTSLPDETKEGRTFAGLRAASRQGSADVYFDKSTSLLARSKRAMPELLGGQETIVENFYDDYRDIQGIHYPMKIRTVAGEAFLTTVTLSTIEFRDKIDDTIFLKPPTPDAQGGSGEVVARETQAQPSSGDGAKTPGNWNKVLIVIAGISGAFIGTLWLIVRASKRGKRETPPG